MSVKSSDWSNHYHGRVRARRGSPKKYKCCLCTDRAANWQWLWKTEDDPEDPWAYAPMCRKHRREYRQGPDEVAAIPPDEIVAVPDAHDMPQWQFIRHVRLRHYKLRDVTFHAHAIDHADNRAQDHVHAASEIWGTVGKHDAMQEALSFPPPMLPAASRMDIPAFVFHAQRQHDRPFNNWQEHDALHAETPDFFDHRHKEDT